VAPADVGDDEPLTQYGHEGDDPPFRNATRSYETDVSLIRGQLSASEAATLIRRQGARYQLTAQDRVRHTTAARLRSAGFVVRATPTRRIPGHVSVELPDPKDVWDNLLGVGSMSASTSEEVADRV
jgi:hypothetical protein